MDATQELGAYQSAIEEAKVTLENLTNRIAEKQRETEGQAHEGNEALEEERDAIIADNTRLRQEQEALKAAVPNVHTKVHVNTTSGREDIRVQRGAQEHRETEHYAGILADILEAEKSLEQKKNDNYQLLTQIQEARRQSENAKTEAGHEQEMAKREKLELVSTIKEREALRRREAQAEAKENDATAALKASEEIKDINAIKTQEIAQREAKLANDKYQLDQERYQFNQQKSQGGK